MTDNSSIDLEFIDSKEIVRYLRMTCQICGKHVKSRRGLAFHVRNQHGGMKLQQYDKLFNKDDDLLECPICGRVNLVDLVKHCELVHKMSIDALKSKFPNIKLRADTYWEHHFNPGKAGPAWQTRSQEDMDKFVKMLKESAKLRKQRDPHCYDKFLEAAHKNQSKRLVELWKDEQYREKMSKKCKRQHETGNLNPMGYAPKEKSYFYESIRMRSSWEVKLAEILDSHNIRFEYETLQVDYELDGKSHRYYPDFYLPECNVLLEVKPQYKLNNPDVIAKRESSIKLGYRYKFVTEKELFNQDELDMLLQWISE